MNYNGKRLLVLGGAEFQIPFLEYAKKHQIFTGIVDMNDNPPAKEYADKVYKCSLKDLDGLLEVAKDFKPDGVTVGMVDVAVPACAYLTETLGLPGPNTDVAKKATNKYEMIKAFEKGNVPHPQFQYVKKEDIGEIKCCIDFPVIVKPIDMAGSRGIFLANDQDELKKYADKSSDIGDIGDLLIEEFMDGPEVSVEIVVNKGVPHVVQITDKTTTGAPHFAETGHLQPSQLSDEIKDRIKEVACAAVKSLGLYNSLTHAEIKITKDGPKMVELGARAGGDAIGEQLLELSLGVSFPEIAVNIAFGEEFDFPVPSKKCVSCIRFIQSRSGILKSINGVNLAEKIENVVLIKITGTIGKEYSNVVDNSGRLGYVISCGDTFEEAKKACDEAISTIDIEFA